jgi:hypothetical protein
VGRYRSYSSSRSNARSASKSCDLENVLL